MLQEYHKGGLCVHKLLMCQEGYCAECHIHKTAMHLKDIDALHIKNSVKEGHSRVLVSSAK